MGRGRKQLGVSRRKSRRRGGATQASRLSRSRPLGVFRAALLVGFRPGPRPCVKQAVSRGAGAGQARIPRLLLPPSLCVIKTRGVSIQPFPFWLSTPAVLASVPPNPSLCRCERVRKGCAAAQSARALPAHAHPPTVCKTPASLPSRLPPDHLRDPASPHRPPLRLPARPLPASCQTPASPPLPGLPPRPPPDHPLDHLREPCQPHHHPSPDCLQDPCQPPPPPGRLPAPAHGGFWALC